MVTITVNGKELKANPKETVLQVLLRNQTVIPHFCYHPKLSIAGVCRMCLVEVEGSRKLEVSCALPVRDSMVVHTESEKVLAGRQFVMEFTLVNHPLDCPICDQAGECWLQEYYMDHDRKPSTMGDSKVHKQKVKPIGPRVMLDQERCILCTRCVRFCDEITKTSELGIFNRGDRSILDIVEDKQLNNRYSENVVDICPVGALTSRDFRFDGRVWFLKEDPSICPGCARGCNTVIHHRDGTIRRILPRVNEKVNGHWMCDDGRTVRHQVHSENRLRKPKRLVDGKLEAISWNKAFETLIPRFLEIKKNGTEKILGMASVRATNEDNFAFIRFLENVLGIHLFSWEDLTPRIWEGDQLLRCEDQNPNTKGAKKVITSACNGKLEVLSGDRIIKELEKESIKGLIILDQDLFFGMDKNAISKLKEQLKKLEFILIFTPFENETTTLAHFSIPITTFAEQDGSFTNCDGIVQHFQKTINPLGESLPLRQILEGLAEGLGVSLPFSGSKDFNKDLKTFLPEYSPAPGSSIR